MRSTGQKERAAQFRLLHQGPPMLILPNAWDAASARIFEQAGSRAIATTSSGVAAALGYSDGQQISRDMLVEATARITRVVECPVTADIEAGYGNSIAEVLRTVQAIIEAGAVGFNIEDSSAQAEDELVEISYQVELIKALRELAASLDIPFVINARVDVFLLPAGALESPLEQAVQRANAYLQAGADCVYPIGVLQREVIAGLVGAINGPVNILGGSPAPALSELENLGVARVSFASRLMRSVLGHLRAVAHALLEQGSYASMETGALSGPELALLFG
jgi:2-methylisocitrate lyase-like PEP mutase family enzyme